MPEHAHPAASTVTPQLDAYPRLCGLPVTIERIAARPVGARRPMARSLTAWTYWYPGTVPRMAPCR
jgi:hypothetical protein